MHTPQKPALFLVLAVLAANGLGCVEAAYDAYCQRHYCGIPPHTVYYVTGNSVYGADGGLHLFHGVVRASLEASATGDTLSAQDYQRIAGWGANVVRLPVTQDYWLAAAALADPTYPGRVDQNIAWAHAAGLDVVLDLQRSDLGNLATTAPVQGPMADVNSLQFWSEVASHYAADGRVLFELYSTPQGVPWDTWLHGDPDAGGVGYPVIGMQQLYDAIRLTGATNLVVVDGLDGGFDLSGITNNRLVGYNIIYATQPFNVPGEGPDTWDAAFGFLTSTDPVMATSFGTYDCSVAYYESFFSYAAAHHLSWTAWAWAPQGCTYPSLITDWTGTPSATGQVVKSHLP